MPKNGSELSNHTNEYPELYKSIDRFIVRGYEKSRCVGNALSEATNTYLSTENKNINAKNIYMKAISDAYESANIEPEMAYNILFEDYYKFTSIVINTIYEDKIEREFYTWLNRLEKVVNETYTKSHYDAYRPYCKEDIPKEKENEKYIRDKLNEMKLSAGEYFAQDKNDRDQKLFNKRCVEQLEQISSRYPIGRELSKFNPIIKGFISFLKLLLLIPCYMVGAPTYRNTFFNSFFRNNICEEAESFKRNVAGGKSKVKEIEDEIHKVHVCSLINFNL